MVSYKIPDFSSEREIIRSLKKFQDQHPMSYAELDTPIFELIAKISETVLSRYKEFFKVLSGKIDEVDLFFE